MRDFFAVFCFLTVFFPAANEAENDILLSRASVDNRCAPGMSPLGPIQRLSAAFQFFSLSLRKLSLQPDLHADPLSNRFLMS